MNTAHATLLVDAGARRVSRADLEALPEPEALGPNHAPHRHATVVQELSAALQGRGLRIVEEQYALNRAKTRLLGTLVVEPTTIEHDLRPAMRPDAQQALAVVSSQDSSSSLRVISGRVVVACTNGMLAASEQVLRRRHVKGLHLASALHDAVDGWIGQQLDFARVVDGAKGLELTADQMKIALFNVFERRLLGPRMFQPVVETLYRAEPSWTDVTEHPTSAYALHSAITRCLRTASPAVRFSSTRRIAYLLSDPLGDPRRN